MKRHFLWTQKNDYKDQCFSKTAAKRSKNGTRRKAKVPYDTKEEADFVVVWMTRKHKMEYNSYLCRNCEHWHVGRPPAPERLQRQRYWDPMTEIEMGERVCAYWYGAISVEKSLRAAERRRQYQ